MSELKPIETAPKDGSSVIGFDPKYVADEQVGQMSYDTYKDHWCWMDEDRERMEPTHWQPLPPPPQGEK